MKTPNVAPGPGGLPCALWRCLPKLLPNFFILGISACAVLCAVAHFLFIRPNAIGEFHVRNSPIRTAVLTDENGIVTSNRKTYSIGNYGVTEFGSIRIAVRGRTFSGESSGRIILASKFAGGGGSTGVGNRRFTYDEIVGGSQCTFAGLKFTIIDSELEILGKKIAANGEPTLVLVNSLGEIEGLHTIGNPD